MSGDRTILALGSAAFAVEEYQAFCEEFTVDSIPLSQVTNHATLTDAVAKAVDARAASKKPPYVAFIWFFGTGRYGPFDQTMLEPLTRAGCRFFSGGGAGYDDVSTDWMAAQGAYYCNTPTAISVSTANGALMLLLNATRASYQGEVYTRAGRWRGNLSDPQDIFPLGYDVEDRTLGIIGLGSIGQALSTRAQACGMKIIYHNRRRVSEAEENGAKYVSLDELLATSDAISINCPLTPETRHLIGPAEFAKMKTGVYIVNTARGAIIDEEALVEALKSGKVAGAGLDVFEKEPKIHSGLLDPSLAYRVSMQPHGTGRTAAAFSKGEKQIMKSVRQYMRGERPEYTVNIPKV
ncbi:D-isomer specific 2-hydroxyacid dehydrogenase [Mycena amicta]|nr:D-isomer specific 2-hydroxyacid dehydrogenase [Mycena amicta]